MSVRSMIMNCDLRAVTGLSAKPERRIILNFHMMSSYLNSRRQPLHKMTIQKWLGKMIPQNLHREMFKEENEQLSSTMGCL